MDDTDFSHWYDAVELRQDPSCWQARRDGVIAFVGDADRDDVEALVRLVFRTRQTAALVAVQKIRQTFKDADDTFDMQGNDRELEVLAGACLVALMDEGKKVGAAAALAVTTAALGNARTPDLPMDLCTLAESAIDRIADANRQRPTLDNDSASGSRKVNTRIKTAITKVRDTQNIENVAAAIDLVARIAHAELQAVRRIVSIQDEELQMLWWLIGQRSWEYDCPFSAVPVDAQPLAFAKELADSTESLPGPPSVKALLSRAGLKENQKVMIPAAINAAAPEWLAQIVKENEEEGPSPVSSPLHFAINRQRETGAGDAWVAGWAATTGVSQTHAVSALQLGLQFYRERLLQEFE